MMRLLPLPLLSLCSGCAVAGYSVKANTADSAERATVAERSYKSETANSLTSEAEQKIVDRAKKEALAEITTKNQNK